MNLDELFSAHAGVLNRRQILSTGCTDADVRRALATGALRRLRTGWYAGPSADAAVVRAVTAGGVASCITALALLGVWVPHDSRPHMRRSRRLRRRRAVSGIVVCDLPHGTTVPTPTASDSALVALAAAARCLSRDLLTVVIDSTLQRSLATRHELEQLWSDAPARVRRALAAADGIAESGTETLVRLRLLRLGIALEAQVWIGAKRVDFLVGRRLIIEVDSKAWHLDADAYERDRERDRQLAALGYHVIRLTYQQVMSGWASVEPDLLAIIRRGDHLREPGVSARTR